LQIYENDNELKNLEKTKTFDLRNW